MACDTWVACPAGSSSRVVYTGLGAAAVADAALLLLLWFVRRQWQKAAVLPVAVSSVSDDVIEPQPPLVTPSLGAPAAPFASPVPAAVFASPVPAAPFASPVPAARLASPVSGGAAAARAAFGAGVARACGSGATIGVRLVGASVARPGGGRRVLRDATAEVRPGRFTAVMGATGAGKTTFLQALMGKVPLVAGSRLVNGAPATGSPRAMRSLIGCAAAPARAAPARVGVRVGVGWGMAVGSTRTRARSYVPQDDVMHDTLTVRENIAYSGARVRVRPARERPQQRVTRRIAPCSMCAAGPVGRRSTRAAARVMVARRGARVCGHRD